MTSPEDASMGGGVGVGGERGRGAEALNGPDAGDRQRSLSWSGPTSEPEQQPNPNPTRTRVGIT